MHNKIKEIYKGFSFFFVVFFLLFFLCFFFVGFVCLCFLATVAGGVGGLWGGFLVDSWDPGVPLEQPLLR